MTRKLLMIVEVEDSDYEFRKKQGILPDFIAETIADDLLSSYGEYWSPPLLKAEWVED